MLEDKKNALIEAIHKAFETTPYPARFDVKDFEGYHWRDLPGRVMFEWGDQLGQLSWGEFRFFMPAFMIFALTSPTEADVLVDGIIYYLAPPPHDADPGRLVMFLNRVKGFSDAEKHVIAQYISLHGELHPPIEWSPQTIEIMEKIMAPGHLPYSLKAIYDRALNSWKDFL